MRIFCYTCARSFPAGEKEIVYDNGSNMAVFRCPTCGIMYIAIDDGKTEIPRLLKLTQTKSYVTDKEKAKPEPSRIIAPTQQRLIVTPAEAAREMRRR